MSERFHFHRFEFKYLIDNRRRDDMIADLLPHMELDPRLEGGKEHYEVLNLYVDSPGLVFYRQKIDGLMFRKKLRFRFYSFDPSKSPHVFLEIKRKRNMTIIKDRVKLSYDDANRIAKNDLTPVISSIDQFSQQQSELLSEFLFEKMRNRLSSKIWVRYNRIPLSARNIPKLRVTFDDNPVAVEAKKGFDFDPRRPHHNLFRNKSVIEVKYNGTLPFWLHKTIQRYQLFREPISKYCNAVERILL